MTEISEDLCTTQLCRVHKHSTMHLRCRLRLNIRGGYTGYQPTGIVPLLILSILTCFSFTLFVNEFIASSLHSLILCAQRFCSLSNDTAEMDQPRYSMTSPASYLSSYESSSSSETSIMSSSNTTSTCSLERALHHHDLPKNALTFG